MELIDACKFSNLQSIASTRRLHGSTVVALVEGHKDATRFNRQHSASSGYTCGSAISALLHTHTLQTRTTRSEQSARMGVLPRYICKHMRRVAVHTLSSQDRRCQTDTATRRLPVAHLSEHLLQVADGIYRTLILLSSRQCERGEKSSASMLVSELELLNASDSVQNYCIA